MKQYIDGEYIKNHKVDGKRKQTLKERIERAKRARRDARLVQVLSK